MKNYTNAPFEDFKAEVLRIAGENDACESQYDRAAAAATPDELLAVIVDNVAWCAINGIATPDMLDFFGQDACWRRGVWYRGETSVENPDKPIYLLGSSSATVKTWGSSSATVETWGSSICRDLTQMKLYVRKSAYKIEVLENV